MTQYNTEEIAPGFQSIWTDIGNDGFLATYGSERWRSSGPGGALVARLSLSDGAELLPGSAPATQQLEHLAGRVSQYTGYHLSARYPNLSRGHVEWLVAAPDGARFELTFQAEKAGTCRTSVTIETCRLCAPNRLRGAHTRRPLYPYR